jgi:uncharacterized membrane protein
VDALLLTLLSVFGAAFLGMVAAVALRQLVPASTLTEQVAAERVKTAAAEATAQTLQETVNKYKETEARRERELERAADLQSMTNTVIHTFQDYLKKPGE